MNPIEQSAQALIQVLSANPNELGARLKQLLIAEYSRRGWGAFDERSLGFANFKDFLERGHSKLVSIKKSDGSPDIQVTLVSSQANHGAAAEPAPRRASKSIIRGEVWQAFSNPDPTRARYYHIPTSRIIHFNKTETSPFKSEVDRAPEQYTTIEPISGDTQISWMKEFLQQNPVEGAELDALQALLGSPYTSDANVVFTRTLGKKADDWRKFRTNRVIEQIRSWAEAAGVSMNGLWTPSSTAGDKAVAANPSSIDVRGKANKLLELMTDEDISRVIIPTMLSTILIRFRL
jgi:hypothetical protein